jgi:hypothetical protein
MVGDTGPGQAAHLPQRHVGQLAGFQRAELIGAAHAAGPADRGHPQRLPRGQGQRAAAEPGRQQRLVQLVDHPARLVGRRAVHPEADRRARVQQGPDRRDAGTQPPVRGGAVGHAGPGGREPPDRLVGQVHAVGQPHVRAEPAQVLGVLRRGPPVGLPAEVLLVGGLGQVGVQPDTGPPGQLGAVAHELGRDRER